MDDKNDAVRIDGTLKSWNESKGFGFIAPRHGGQEIFVHISEYPRPGGKPRIGEALSFAIALDAEGRKKAVKVRRPESARARPAAASPRPATGLWGKVVPAAIIALMLAAGYKYFAPRLLAGTPAAAQPFVAAPNPLDPPAAAARGQASAELGQWRCDGRQHCSQMTSCEEARFFLRNCPGVKMDGDGDGIPCEDQLCGH